jgi:hypothetical protein
MEGGAVGHTQGPSMPGFRGEDFLNISAQWPEPLVLV